MLAELLWRELLRLLPTPEEEVRGVATLDAAGLDLLAEIAASILTAPAAAAAAGAAAVAAAAPPPPPLLACVIESVWPRELLLLTSPLGAELCAAAGTFDFEPLR